MRRRWTHDDVKGCLIRHPEFSVNEIAAHIGASTLQVLDVIRRRKWRLPWGDRNKRGQYRQGMRRSTS